MLLQFVNMKVLENYFLMSVLVCKSLIVCTTGKVKHYLVPKYIKYSCIFVGLVFLERTDNGHYMIALFFYMSKAFDSINHLTLFKKIYNFMEYVVMLYHGSKVIFQIDKFK